MFRNPLARARDKFHPATASDEKLSFWRFRSKLFIYCCSVDRLSKCRNASFQIAVVQDLLSPYPKFQASSHRGGVDWLNRVV